MKHFSVFFTSYPYIFFCADMIDLSLNISVRSYEKSVYYIHIFLLYYERSVYNIYLYSSVKDLFTIYIYALLLKICIQNISLLYCERYVNCIYLCSTIKDLYAKYISIMKDLYTIYLCSTMKDLFTIYISLFYYDRSVC